MPTLNKETKNKTLVLKMQLTTEQHVLVVKTFYKTSSYLKVKEVFRRRFPEKDPPTNRTIWKNVGKYKTERINLNINKAGSGRRRRTVRTKETIELFRFHVEDNAKNVSCRRNVLVAVLLTK